jgi:putative tryptophan/tyrosine transport system substrate-binding protein
MLRSIMWGEPGIMTRTIAGFITVFTLVSLTTPCASQAQQTAQLYRIGWLHPSAAGPRATFRDALRELGYVEGKNLAFEVRGAEGKFEQFPRLAAELVASRVDVLVAVAPTAIRAARQATSTIPIVMAYWGGPDLVEAGIIASLARPGGNVTGVSMLNPELDVKRLELLVEAVPGGRKLAVLVHDLTFAFGGAPAHFSEVLLPRLRAAAREARVQLHVAEVAPRGAYEAAFDGIVRSGANALLVPSSPIFTADRKRIIELAATHRLPTMYEWGYTAREGGLMAYGTTLVELDRRAAAFVDRILKGAKPGDLPIEQPTRFELVINMRTAKSLSLPIPRSVLLRADEVIE